MLSGNYCFLLSRQTFCNSVFLFYDEFYESFTDFYLRSVLHNHSMLCEDREISYLNDCSTPTLQNKTDSSRYTILDLVALASLLVWTVTSSPTKEQETTQ